jgi:hypothetical protein
MEIPAGAVEAHDAPVPKYTTRGDWQMNITTNRKARRGAGLLAAAAVALWVALLPPRGATATPVHPVPQDIAVPAGNVLAGVGNAEGFQIYTCGAAGWTLQQPMAVLNESGHKAFALHYGGPTWMALDGSAVVGTRAGIAPAPTPGNIPWLLLSAAPADGSADGILSGTTFIQRLNTAGGTAPASGCDADHLGASAPVFYTADYYFYRAG